MLLQSTGLINSLNPQRAATWFLLINVSRLCRVRQRLSNLGICCRRTLLRHCFCRTWPATD